MWPTFNLSSLTRIYVIQLELPLHKYFSLNFFFLQQKRQQFLTIFSEIPLFDSQKIQLFFYPGRIKTKLSAWQPHQLWSCTVWVEKIFLQRLSCMHAHTLAHKSLRRVTSSILQPSLGVEPTRQKGGKVGGERVGEKKERRKSFPQKKTTMTTLCK